MQKRGPKGGRCTGVPSFTYQIAQFFLSLWAKQEGPPFPGLGLGGLAAPPPPPSCLGATAQLSQPVAVATGSSSRPRVGESSEREKLKGLTFPFGEDRAKLQGTYLPGLRARPFEAQRNCSRGFKIHKLTRIPPLPTPGVNQQHFEIRMIKT